MRLVEIAAFVGTVKRSSLTLFVILVGWLLSMGVFYVLGLFSAFAFHRSPEAGTLEGLDRSQREFALLVSVHLDDSVDWSAIESLDGTTVPTQIQKLLDALARHPNELHRAARVVADLVSPRRVGTMVQALSRRETLSGPEAALREALVRRWGEIDGRSALDFALAGGRSELVVAALEGWALKSPDPAWDWVKLAGGAPETQTRRLTAVLRVAGWSDAEVALRLGSLEDRMLANDLSVVRARELYLSDGVTKAFAFAEATTDNYAARTRVLRSVLEEWTLDAPAEARQWVERIPLDQRDWALAGYARARGKAAPEETLRWLASLPATSGMVVAMADTAGQWLDAAGPAALGEFLNQTDDFATYQPTIEPLVMATLDYDPATAYSWSELVNDESRRLYLQLVIAMRWEDVDPEGASTLLARLAGNSGTVRTIPANATNEPIEVAPGETLVIEEPAEESAEGGTEAEPTEESGDSP